MALQGRRARLLLEYEKLINLQKRSDFIKVEPVDILPGMPPEKYVVTFTCGGIAEVNEDKSPKYSEFHQVLMNLSRDFPNQEPYLKWLTPIWHPNIEHKEPNHVCTNNVQNWYPSKSLDDLVISLGEMVQYRRYHAAWVAPFPLDKEAADWVVNYAEPNGLVSLEKPVDNRRLLRPIKSRLKGGQKAVAAPPPIPQPVSNRRLKLGVRITAETRAAENGSIPIENPFSQEIHIPKPTFSEELRVPENSFGNTGESVRRQGITFGKRKVETVETAEKTENVEKVEIAANEAAVEQPVMIEQPAMVEKPAVVEQPVMIEQVEKFCNDCGEKFTVRNTEFVINGRYLCERCEIFYRS